ncbi:hypothetical protein BDZ45DRAFT_744161 [Acephala macrosclerotiorum]|nr:hypothetical protein BDZ45DRAFT_744161 [Acephala macrosclerotiorum]
MEKGGAGRVFTRLPHKQTVSSACFFILPQSLLLASEWSISKYAQPLKPGGGTAREILRSNMDLCSHDRQLLTRKSVIRFYYYVDKSNRGIRGYSKVEPLSLLSLSLSLALALALALALSLSTAPLSMNSDALFYDAHHPTGVR